MYERVLRQPGERLRLGDMEYVLGGVEGAGGSTVVYRASYADGLDRDSAHQVLIKELYPFHPKGAVYRDGDGSIRCTPEGEDLMALGRERFMAGNRLNLELLSRLPGQISGNLNSWEAFGTYYSVLSVHGGENLQALLDGGKRYTLREAAQTVLLILDALSCFHKSGYLHLDISPDNVLLLPNQAFLIDYNSVWPMGGDPGGFAISEKDGYSAPEVRLREMDRICPATDLYGVCAVFFRLVAGRRLEEREIQGSGLKKTLSGPLPGWEGAPPTAVSKAAQILLRGLNVLSRRRCQTAEELRGEMEELIARIDGRGITRSALWESSRAACRRLREEARYLDQSVSLRGGRELTREELLRELQAGGRYLLSGPGGMGKTRLLTELWRQETAAYRPKQPVVIRVALKEYQGSGGTPDFILRQILRGLSFGEKDGGFEDALHRLEQLLEEAPGGQAGTILLLDGLNEAGERREKLLLEIERLGGMPGVGVLVTDRSEEVLGYGLKQFIPAQLCPLPPETIREELAAGGLETPKNKSLAALLSNPMMLGLYLRTGQDGAAGEAAPESAEELIRLYLDGICSAALRGDSGDAGKQLCSRYILRFLLPEIAAEMQNKKRTLLSFDELCAVSDKSYRRLCSASFGKAFPEYRGKTRVMLEGIRGEAEWHDFAVSERLTDQLGLLMKLDDGRYGLIHDNFLDVLAGMAEENRKTLLRRTRKQRWTRVGAVAAAVLAAGGIAIGAALHSSAPAAPSYTAEEERVIYDAIVCLDNALGRWNGQITALREVLAQAEVSDVLDNRDELANQKLSQLIGQKRQFLSSVYGGELGDALYGSLAAIPENGKPLFPPETLRFLCTRSRSGEAVTEGALAHLERALCSPDSVYASRDKRERVLRALSNYLDAEVKYVSYHLAVLLAEATPEQGEQIVESMAYMDAFRDFYDGPGSVAPERLADGLSRAYETLKQARDEMRAQGYPIDWSRINDQ